MRTLPNLDWPLNIITQNFFVSLRVCHSTFYPSKEEGSECQGEVWRVFWKVIGVDGMAYLYDVQFQENKISLT